MRKNGFLSLEYAVMVAIIVAAIIGMSVYFQRALQGKMRDAGDNLGSGRQYSP